MMIGRIYFKRVSDLDKRRGVFIFIVFSLILIFISTLGCSKKQCDIIETDESGK